MLKYWIIEKYKNLKEELSQTTFNTTKDLIEFLDSKSNNTLYKEWFIQMLGDRAMQVIKAWLELIRRETRITIKDIKIIGLNDNKSYESNIHLDKGS